MPIVDQQIVKNHVEGNTRFVVYEFVDHLGNKYQRFKKHVTIDFDIDADILALVPQVENELAENEALDARDRVIKGEDSLAVVLNPKHGTSKQIARSLIRWMMEERNPYIVILLEPLFSYLMANYTSTQFENFLGITSVQATKAITRVNAILNNKVDLLMALSNMEVIE